MPRRLYDIAFITLAVALVALVGLVNCLQGTPFVGALKCGYGYTSGDLILKAIATVIFLLFLGLLLGPVAVTILRPSVEKGRNRTKPQIHGE
jgi:uncharacterized membrane protein